MKSILFCIALVCPAALLLITPFVEAQQERPVVRLIYFLPKDRQPQLDIDAKMDRLIKDVQQAFADVMAYHGFGRKTFLFETDTRGNAVVHHIKGRFNDAYYRKESSIAWDEIKERFDLSKNYYLTVLDISAEHFDGFTCGSGSSLGSHGGRALIHASGNCPGYSFGINLAAHELTHAFGIFHYLGIPDNLAFVPNFSDEMTVAYCTAEWLDAHSAFNPRQSVSSGPTTIEMLPPSFVGPPNAIRLRFRVTDPDGLHQIRLEADDMLDCQGLNGNPNTRIVEFVTTHLGPNRKSVFLMVMDASGEFTRSANFPIDIASLLPPARPLSIPDANLAAAVRKEIGNSITTHTILNLSIVFADGVTDLTGLEHAHNLEALYLYHNAVSDFSALAGLKVLSYFVGNVPDISVLPTLPVGTLGILGSSVSDVAVLSRFPGLTSLHLNRSNISDISSLSGSTQLTVLNLNHNDISDISSLSRLTPLVHLDLKNNDISDISSLSGLTQLRVLYLFRNNISDVSALSGLIHLTELDVRGNPLSYASVHTHIPAMQARGVEVQFNERTHPALIKVSGDGQVGEVGAILANPFIVEAVNGRGKPMKEVPVTFTVTADDGTLITTTAMTDTKGRGRTTLRLGSTPGVNTITVTAKGIRSSVIFTARATGPPIYWMDAKTGRLHRSVESLVEILVPRVQNATSLVLDVANGKLYWTEQTGETTGRIRRANLDGSKVQLVKSLTSVPLDLALDTTNGKLYLINASGKIQRLNFDGSNYQPNFIIDLKSPKSLALDVAGNKIYWTEQTGKTTGRIRRANLDGSNVQLVKSLTSVPLDLALDTTNGKLYLSNAWGKIQRMNFNGSNYEPNLITGLESPGGIGVDTAGGKLYWTEKGRIRCADLNGENIQEIVTGIGTPADVALGISGDIVPAAPMNVSLAASQTASPDETVLLANYPNPFNPETWIPYQLAKPAEVTLHIYAVNGALVRTLVLGHQAAGMYQSRSRAAYWDGRNAHGEKVASGLYFYTLTAGDFTATRKLLIRK